MRLKMRFSLFVELKDLFVGLKDLFVGLKERFKPLLNFKKYMYQIQIFMSSNKDKVPRLSLTQSKGEKYCKSQKWVKREKGFIDQ